MNGLIWGIHAEGLKMRHTFLYPFHVAVPFFVSMVFLFYYKFAGWSEMAQISGYMEVIGVSLPFVISIVCAGNIRLEEQNHFQIILGSYIEKWKGFWIKWFVLAGMGFLAIFGAVALFGAGFHFGLGKEGISVVTYMQLIMVLFFGSVLVYLEHLFLNLMFPRTVSQCVGVAESLLSALFLTGLGEGRWQLFPCTWSARGVLILLNGMAREEIRDVLFAEMKCFAVICMLLLILMCAIIGIWFHFYEGRQCND